MTYQQRYNDGSKAFNAAGDKDLSSCLVRDDGIKNK